MWWPYTDLTTHLAAPIGWCMSALVKSDIQMWTKMFIWDIYAQLLFEIVLIFNSLKYSKSSTSQNEIYHNFIEIIIFILFYTYSARFDGLVPEKCSIFITLSS